MKNCNFIRVIAFIFIFLIFFAVSVHDPFVYAKMRTVDENSLAKIEGEAGITIDMNVTVRSVAETNFSIDNLTGDSINMGPMEIGNGTAGGNFSVNTQALIDIGTNGDGQTWLRVKDLAMPSSTLGIGVLANDLYIVDNTTSTVHIGNLAVTGIFLGRNVTSVNGAAITPTLNVDGTLPWVMISSHKTTNGFELKSELGAYIDKLKYVWSSSGASNNLTVSGIYVYGYDSAATGVGNIDTWGTELKGRLALGGSFPTFYENGTLTGSTVSTIGSVDIGTNTSTNGTMMRLSLPLAGTLRVRNFTMGGTSFGPLTVDSVAFYRLNISIRNLNASDKL